MIRNFKDIGVNDVAIAGGKGANLGELTRVGISVPEGFVVTSDAYRLFLRENGLEELFAKKLKDAGNDEAKLFQCAKEFRARIREGKLPAAVEKEIAEAYGNLGKENTEACGTPQNEGLEVCGGQRNESIEACGGQEKESTGVYGDQQKEASEVCGGQKKEGAAVRRRMNKGARVAVRSSATAEDLADASFAGQQETYLNVVGLEQVLNQIRNCYASLWGNRAVVYRQNQGYDQSTVALAVVVQRMVESEVAGVLFTVNPVSGNREEIQVNASYGLGESVVSGRVTADSYVCDRAGRLLHRTLGSKETQIIYAEDGSGTREVAVAREARQQCALEEGVLQKLCKEGRKIEAYYKKPMDIEWGICGGKIYILQARAITTLKAETSGAEEARIEGYLKNCKCTGTQRENMAFLLEKMPYVFYPFDYELIEVIDDQKSNIFAEAGIIMDMQPQIDEDGVMILPPNGMKINGKLLHFPALVKELKDLEGCKKRLDRDMESYRRELAELCGINYDALPVGECALLFPKMIDFVRRLTYCRFKYALFPSVLCKGRFEKALRKVDPGLTAFDLYRNLDYETAVMSRDLEGLASALGVDERVKAAILEGMDYKRIREKFPETGEMFDAFLSTHGFKSDFNCYCVTAKAFYEAPNRMLHLVQLLFDREPSEKEEDFETLMGRLKAAVGEQKYKKLREKIDIFRYMHVIREESQLMWETCFYYTKKLLRRTSLLLCGQEDYMRELAYLFLSELTVVCEQGTLKEADREKIRRRREMRPLAEKVWERAKLKVFPDTGDVLKGVSGSVGETVGRARLISGPEEFYKFQKGDVLVCRFTDPEWTTLFSLASAVVADTGAELSHAAIVAREYGIPAVLGVGHATTRYKDGDMIRVNGTKGEVSKVE